MTHPNAEILYAIIDGEEVQWTTLDDAEGKCWQTLSEEHHGVMAQVLLGSHNKWKLRIKPSTVTINGVELEDDRVSSAELKSGQKYFIEVMHIEELCNTEHYTGHEYDSSYIQRGIAHHTREGAIAFCKARLGIKD